jgi:two-component system C4-dicarboxylate transport sensor histidine kinase DctB
MIGPDGTTIAASNFDKRSSFIGQKFSYRPCFEDALAKDFARLFGVGTTSGLRG